MLARRLPPLCGTCQGFRWLPERSRPRIGNHAQCLRTQSRPRYSRHWYPSDQTGSVPPPGCRLTNRPCSPLLSGIVLDDVWVSGGLDDRLTHVRRARASRLSIRRAFSVVWSRAVVVLRRVRVSVPWIGRCLTAPTGSSLHRLGVLDIVLGALIVPTIAAIATIVIWLALRWLDQRLRNLNGESTRPWRHSAVGCGGVDRVDPVVSISMTTTPSTNRPETGAAEVAKPGREAVRFLVGARSVSVRTAQPPRGARRRNSDFQERAIAHRAAVRPAPRRVAAVEGVGAAVGRGDAEALRGRRRVMAGPPGTDGVGVSDDDKERLNRLNQQLTRVSATRSRRIDLSRTVFSLFLGASAVLVSA